MVLVDKNILFLISENSRARLKDLSTILRKTPQRLKYNIDTFKKGNILKSPHCIFDYSYFGLILFKVYFKGGYISETDKKGIIRKLNANRYIISIYEMSGEFDLAIEMLSPNPSRFNKELKNITSLIPTLNDYKIVLNLVTHIYPRQYLPKNKNLTRHIKSEIVIGGDRAIRSFSDNEMRVIKNLYINPNIRYTHLAKYSDLNIKTVRSILKKLEKNRIIRGFKYTLDTNQLGIYKFRLFLKTHNIIQEREKELLDFMKQNKEIIQLKKTVGDWNIEIDIESMDKTRIRRLIIEIRENFKDIIETFNIMEFYEQFKESYLPKYIFEE